MDFWISLKGKFILCWERLQGVLEKICIIFLINFVFCYVMLVLDELVIWVNMDSQHRRINLQNVWLCNFNLQTFASKFTLCILYLLLYTLFNYWLGKYMNINNTIWLYISKLTMTTLYLLCSFTHLKIISLDVHFKGHYSMWDLLTLFCFILSFQTFKCDLSFKDDLTKNWT